MAGRINRREAFVGAALAAWAVPVVAAGAGVVVATWTPGALTSAQARTLDVAAELIMPATTTPGAREAGVPQFVDRAVGTYLTPAEARAIRAGLDRMDAEAKAAHGAGFAALTPEQQTAMLTRYDAEARAPRAAPVGRGDTETGLTNAKAATPPPQGPAFFPLLKELVTVGYFTSRLGATRAVRYDPVPGPYKGCVPLSRIGRAWAM